MALGLGLASLVPTQADAQSAQGGVSLRPAGKNHATVQHTRRVGISPARPMSKPGRAHNGAGETRGGAPVNDNCAGAITLNDQQVKKLHALIGLAGGVLTIEDLVQYRQMLSERSA